MLPNLHPIFTNNTAGSEVPWFSEANIMATRQASADPHDGVQYESLMLREIKTAKTKEQSAGGGDQENQHDAICGLGTHKNMNHGPGSAWCLLLQSSLERLFVILQYPSYA